MKIALAQMDIVWNKPQDNYNKIDKFIKEAKDKNVELILFPEMCLTGFNMDIHSFKEDEKDILSWFSNKAIENNINIGFGYAVLNKNKNKGENKYAVISKEGKQYIDYVKIHPFSMSREDKYFIKGENISLCKINGVTISTFICYDLRFPYIFQKASTKAQLITVASNWPMERREQFITLLKARAIENQCFIVGVNRVGSGDNLNYSGDSMIINPNGEIIANAYNKEMLLVADINIEEINKLKEHMNLLKDRRYI